LKDETQGVAQMCNNAESLGGNKTSRVVEKKRRGRKRLARTGERGASRAEVKAEEANGGKGG